MENNYDFRARHLAYHKPDMRRSGVSAGESQVMLDEGWSIQCPEGELAEIAAKDFQDYLATSQRLSLPIRKTALGKQIVFQVQEAKDLSFAAEICKDRITITASSQFMLLRAGIYLEDLMNFAGAPMLDLGSFQRHNIYRRRTVHSGLGIDEFPDEELMAIIHAGYDTITIFVKDFLHTAAGPANIGDIIRRAKRLGMKVGLYNYIGTFKHPDDSDAEECYDRTYGELMRRFPQADYVSFCGESLEFPSKDPATSGKKYSESVINGIPDTRPSPGWYPCSDYPRYLEAIGRAMKKVNPNVELLFSTYNWGYQSEEVRRQFLEKWPRHFSITITYEIFSQRRLEGLHTPVMDYTISAQEPGFYFQSECKNAHALGIPIVGNVNTAGVCWDFGCIPYVPVPSRWYRRSENLRDYCLQYGVDAHYATHHYGWWNCVAADIGKWMCWREIKPSYEDIASKVAERDYGCAAPQVLSAWRKWGAAMEHYTASNEDQYGPWRVGAAYPFIFQPNISRTMLDKEIHFPTSPTAHFGNAIIKTLYQPYENSEQTPGFLRYPAELRSLQKMLELWKEGLAELDQASVDDAHQEDFTRLQALGQFILHSIVTVMHIKRWWLENIAMLASSNPQDAERHLDAIQAIAHEEIANARSLIPYVEADSRLGWEASMEYVCDKWHLEWKIRQVESALREIGQYRKMLHL